MDMDFDSQEKWILPGEFMPYMPGIHRHFGNHLKHIEADWGMYHVVFRLADSIPQSALQLWRQETDELELLAKQNLLNEEQTIRLAYLKNEWHEYYLHQGAGSCIFRDRKAAQIMRDNLMSNDGKDYELCTWCIMPNHVHAMLSTLNGMSLSDILKKWKSASALEINRALNRHGKLWENDFYNRIVRTSEEYHWLRRYIWKNPSSAHLYNWHWRWSRTPVFD